MLSISKINPMARAVLVIGAVAALVTSMTFAALQSSVTLTGNTLSAADSNLQIWNGTTYADTANGFDVDNLVPGEWSDENYFYFKNASEGDLKLAAMSSEPVLPEGASDFGFSGWENLKVRITSYNPECNAEEAVVPTSARSSRTMTNDDNHDEEPPVKEEPAVPANGAVVETNMADLIAGDVELPCNPLSEGAQGNGSQGSEATEGNYSVAYKITKDSVTGSDINIGEYNLTFTGTLVSGSDDNTSEL